jgi:hypothetical protein
VPDTRTITIRFELKSEGETSATEFVSLFECVDFLGQSIVEAEAQTFLEVLELSSESRLAALQSLHRSRRRVSPVEVREVEKGSWIVETVIQGAAILWVIQNFVTPVMKEAWDESRLRELLLGFFRSRVFGRAKQTVEVKAAEHSRFGNLRVISVEEPSESTPDEPVLVVRIERSEVVEVRVSDKELIDQFLRRLRNP